MKKAKARTKAAAARKTPKAVPQSAFHIEPLPATFSLIGLLGFIITTVFTVSGRVPLSWGVAFDIVFVLMFIASMISITPKFAGWD
ncbi:hypothetical protein HYU40_05220 [Candidatus Woesearchaeota archaeon]|nr:hypothetical protein [Candidatus Woesearchaeota archaeon]